LNRFTIDIHQHLWPEPLLAALAGRALLPRLRGSTLELDGEPPVEIDITRHDPVRRAAEARAQGLDLALLSLSSPLGIELLAPDESKELLAAYHDGTRALEDSYAGWAAACLTDVDPRALAAELDRGFVGLQLPASALITEAGYEHVAPLLELLERRRRPLFIHPGPVSPPSPATPSWWPAIVAYVQQLHAAWYAFRAYGRARHPELVVCFAMLAGLAPLHSERLAARAGLRTAVDDGVFLDVSSYGTRAIDATIRALGIDALVNGSDAPYAAPVSAELSPAALVAIHSSNPLRLLDLKGVRHDLARLALP
jgi:hypothetical protein